MIKQPLRVAMATGSYGYNVGTSVRSFERDVARVPEHAKLGCRLGCTNVRRRGLNLVVIIYLDLSKTTKASRLS